MGRICRFGFSIFGVLAICMSFAAAPAHANSKYAALVIHADTGDVLFSRYANGKRYPASLTKLMTLYMVFEALEEEELTLETKLPVSKRASLQPASRLGLRRGSHITVETAIEALVIKSANDVATVVAEHVGGSEAKFARLMTQRARKLGMRSTTFRNASGLPDRRQVTTAKDMAILAQRVSQDFPQYFEYFNQDKFTWNGRTYRSHNRVTKTMKGADGLKTGYTRASGYNLSTTVERGDNRLIGIVLGGRSSATRDRHMKDILEKAFLDIRRRPTLVKSIHRVKPVPGLRPGRTPQAAPILLAEANPSVSPLPIPIPRPKSMTEAEALNFASLEKAIAEMASDEGQIDVTPIGQGDADLSNLRDWAIQVGAFHKQPQALAQITAHQDAMRELVAGVGREVNIADKGARAVYRARFTRLTEDEALDACDLMREKGTDCIALQMER
ncbi:MAG: D-alanyl-D-alanine carboxypeptidase family protein [Pseudomonadota bacterium]